MVGLYVDHCGHAMHVLGKVSNLSLSPRFAYAGGFTLGGFFGLDNVPVCGDCGHASTPCFVSRAITFSINSTSCLIRLLTALATAA